MICPIRCFSCSHVLADKWEYWELKCKQLDAREQTPQETEKTKDMKNMDKKTRGDILDELGLTRLCCRRIMLSTVDMMDLI